MSITDEVREWAKGDGSYSFDEFDDIADRIDAEHESACAEAYGNGVQSVALRDMTAYVKLPVDADGETIHIGDVLTDDAEFKSEGKVMRLMLEDEGWMVGIGCGGWTEPSIHEWHHHHTPTVEDKLWELIDALGIDRDKCSPVMVENAARELQLREGA